MGRGQLFHRRTILTGAVAAAAWAHRSVRAAPRRQVCVVNGRIFANAEADTVVIADNRIVAVGRREKLAGQFAADATILDARGGHVLPGFHDSHLHMLSGGESLRQLDLFPHRDLAGALDAIARYDRANPGNSWLRGRGWQYSLAPAGQFPSRRDLDRVVPDRPVLLRSFDGHTAWVNSRALAIAQIDRDTADPRNGTILREADGGHPTGILVEEAQSLVKRAVPESTRAEKLSHLAAAVEHCSRLGVTSATDVYADLDELDLYRELHAADRLPIRISVSLPLDGDLDAYAALPKTSEHGFLRLGFLKDFLDGVVESKTAYLLAPYMGSAERGKPHLGRARLDERIEAARVRGFQVGFHSIGDAATRLGLDAFHAATPHGPGATPRGRLEHLEIVDPEDLRRFRGAGVIASMQPLHAKPESADPDAGAWSVLLGRQRLRHTFPWRQLLDAGATLAFGSDWPVMSADPLWGLAVATTRQDERGAPRHGWNAHQCITAEEAVRAYTEGSALADGVAADRGRLRAGMLADLVVLEPTVDFREAATLWSGPRVRYVIVDGRVLPPHL